ncbi:hypothetical protein Saga11_01500 [Bacillus safensis]|nr:hypothetical protein Saga11_01500 [Bacillus safensis]
MHADINSMHMFNRAFILYKRKKYFKKKYHSKNLDDKQVIGENVSIFCLNVFVRVENARLSC